MYFHLADNRTVSNELSIPLHKKRSFPLWISSVNMTKSAVTDKWNRKKMIMA